MPRKRPTEAFVDLGFPVAGVDQSAGYQSQRPQTTRVGLNVRGWEPLTGRNRGGRRPGLSKYVAGRLPAAPVQNLATVVSVSQTALPWFFDYPFLNFPDPSSPGAPTDWGPGKFSRVPPLLLPTGGWPFQPAKNLPKPVRVVWARPADIGVGTALSGTQLNAQAQDAITGNPVSGSFAYAPASGAVLPQGPAQALAATFTAQDPQSYQTGLAAANLINVVSQGHSGIKFVQGDNGGFAAPVTAGNLLVVVKLAVAGDSAAPHDTLGNAYTLAADSGSQDGAHIGLWYAIANGSGGNTVSGGFELSVAEFSGVSASAPEDAAVGNSGQASGPPSGSGPVTAATGGLSVSGPGELAFYGFASVVNSAATPAGFTQVGAGPNGFYKIGPAQGVLSPAVTYDAQFDITGAAYWRLVAATFLPAS